MPGNCPNANANRDSDIYAAPTLHTDVYGNSYIIDADSTATQHRRQRQRLQRRW